MRVLLTGGCGFIGSHQATVLLEAGHDVTIVDDLSNSRVSVLDRVTKITGRQPQFEKLDVRNADALADVISRHRCEAIIHFAGLKHVAESVQRPVDYLDVNIAGMTALLRAAERSGIRRLIFSSSGSVYGDGSTGAITEDTLRRPTNPYSRSKAICEDILATLCEVDLSWSVVALRYFNPAGAHPSGLIGEDPTHLVSNIVPVIMEVALGRRSAVPVHGTDFDTPDGTAVRDYVHVVDVATAHMAALDLTASRSGFSALNIGRGEGVSVRQLIAAAELALDTTIPVEESGRRAGDVASLIADTTLSRKLLGSIPYADVEQIFRDAWRFHVNGTERT